MVATLAAIGLMTTLMNMAPPAAVPPRTRVRPQTALAAAVVQGAVAKSPTVAKLIANLETSDLYVFIDLTMDTSVATAKTTFLTANSTGRFVHIVMNATIGEYERIELLAHELQHVTEIARTPSVRDQATFRAMLHDIGWAVRAKEFETDAARQVEMTVHRELTALHTRR